ncbi:Unconventional myosin [Seminavis robusta]|uniref:Unconventional myosin n=1 Tax=Seminavis robusta TaxID=568900 RepID=A0A9N8EL48_9STRA|nr:Unconventional myosin [Seminavis robusta]|eukprot:Sro1108_g242190.1 Unconventional myosin (1272) ;mRNA; f:21267-25173
MPTREEEKKEGPDGSNTNTNAVTTLHHHVYVRSEDHGWVPGRVIRIHKEEAEVEIDKFEDEQAMLSCTTSAADGDASGNKKETYSVDLQSYTGGVLPLQNTDDRGLLMDYEDMVDMPYLHEASILYNLKQRHLEEKPYTRSGDVVIAINPYQWYHHLYQPDQQFYYANKLLWDDYSKNRIVIVTPQLDIPGQPSSAEEAHPEHPAATPKEIPPHVYETSTLAYKGMALWGQPQSILVSGESGAGKTETVKICMHHIAELQHGPYGGNNNNDGTKIVVQRVLDSNPLLEAFGNAQTNRNDNSSRFGKYTQLQFDRQQQASSTPFDDQQMTPAKLAGSISEVYLLEKNRVVHHDRKNERTFHIFYELLAAPGNHQTAIWEEGLKGSTLDSFRYVGMTTTQKIEGVSDRNRFLKTVKALEVVGIAGDLRHDLFRSLCVVLQLGNLIFAPDPTDDDKSVIASEEELEKLAALMGEGQDVLRKALTERTMTTNNEVYKVPLNAVVAKESCDALAKDIYEKVFLWLVRTINIATSAERNYQPNNSNNKRRGSVGKKTKGPKYGVIGLLDIFGFEAFRVNRFEQLCINYANEKLQYKFTEDCFRLVEAEYKEEGVPLDNITYYDNTDVLDLIEGKTGLLAMLNEECWRPQGNAATFVNKALHQNAKSSCLIVNTMDRISFGVHHYAGKVLYDADNFVRRNQDGLASDLKECALRSTNPIIAGEYAAATEEAKAEEQAAGRSTNSNLMAKTVWTKYKTQLSKLMADLKETESRYVRCIKPNELKAPLLLEHRLTINQLRSCGIVSSVTISRSAFPNRMLNKHVLTRFGGIWHRKKKGEKTVQTASSLDKLWKAEAEALLSYALMAKRFKDPTSGKPRAGFVVGKTKAFFREGALEYLEAERMKGLDRQAAKIQRAYRAFLEHKDEIRAAAALRRRREWHQRKYRERREKRKAEEGKWKAALAQSEEEFEAHLAADWQKFSETMAEEDRLFKENLEREEIARQAQADADNQQWKEKMEREEQEWKSRMEEAAKARSAPDGDDLAKVEAEIAALKKRLQEVDLEAGEKVKESTEHLKEARSEKTKLDFKIDVDATQEERDLKRECIFAKAILEERENFIEQLKREQKRLGKMFDRTKAKKAATEESNKTLTEQCKTTSVKFERSRRQSITLGQGIESKQDVYKAVKERNQELHALTSKQDEAYSLLAESKLELQHTMAAILEIVQNECKDEELRSAVMRINVKTSRDAYKQMKLVQQMQQEAMKNRKDFSVSDLDQSWAVH